MARFCPLICLGAEEGTDGLPGCCPYQPLLGTGADPSGLLEMSVERRGQLDANKRFQTGEWDAAAKPNLSPSWAELGAATGG